MLEVKVKMKVSVMTAVASATAAAVPSTKAASILSLTPTKADLYEWKNDFTEKSKQKKHIVEFYLFCESVLSANDHRTQILN